MRQRPSSPRAALLALALALAAPPATAQSPHRLTDGDLPLLREYLAIDAAAAEQGRRQQGEVEARAGRGLAEIEAERESMRRRIRSGALDQLALLHEGRATGLLVPPDVRYDTTCSRAHFVNPGLVVFRGPRLEGDASARTRIAAWVAWYEARGYGTAAAYTPGVTLVGPTGRAREAREVHISLHLEDEQCGDREPRIHVNGAAGEEDRQAGQIARFNRLADSLAAMAAPETAEDVLAARQGDVAAYVRRRDAVVEAFITRELEDVAWSAMAEGEPADRRAEIAIRRANVRWLLGPGAALLPLAARYVGVAP